MTMFEIVLRVACDSENCSITRRFSSLRMLLWCNREHDVIEITIKEPEEYFRFMEEVPKPDGVVRESSDSQSFHLITKPCTCMESPSVVSLTADLDILHVSPSLAEKGWEYHRLIMFRHEDFEKLMERFGEAGFVVEILRKVPFDGLIASSLTLSADAIFSDLTDKQIDAILTAHKFGYYKFPRSTDVQTIAARTHVPRTTYSDNLKKAENKVVSALVPYIQLFSQAPKEKRTSLNLKHRPLPCSSATVPK